MGLDIYLEKGSKAKWNKHYDSRKRIDEIWDQIEHTDMDPTKRRLLQDEAERLSSTVYENSERLEEVGYFRKINSFLNWVHNRHPEVPWSRQMWTELSKEDIEECIKVTDEVMHTSSMQRIKEIFPTTQGFFFGSDDYDDWYFHDVKRVNDTLNVILENTDWENEVIVYTESW